MRRPYATTFLLVFASLALAVAAFNVLVDPFDVFQYLRLDGWNASKYGGSTREERGLALWRDNYDALVVGSSRAEVGYRPDHPAWGGRPVYVAALGGTNLYELEHVYAYAARKQRPKVVLLALDFLLFGSRRTTRPGFTTSAFNPERDNEATLPQLTLSLFALQSSVSTLARNRRGEAADYWRGHRYGRRTFAAALAEDGHSRLFDKTIRDFLRDPTLYRDYVYGADRLASLKAMVDHARADGTEVHLVINPVHAVQLETVRAAGLWPTFEQWKRDLVRVAEGGGAPVPLWDFTAYTGPQAEPVPPDGDLATRMQWYFECSHFTEALGDRVLARVLPPERTAEDQSFGTRLDSADLEAHLDHLRQDRERYAAEFPDEVRRVERARDDVATGPPSAQQ